jgi:hypothetical protein
MNLIFLDVDGVLNSEEYYVQRGKLASRHGSAKYYDPVAIKYLNRLIKWTNAKIVFSSSHRHGSSLEQINALFKEVGIIGECIGKTPDLYFEKYGEPYDSHMDAVPRGCEIEIFLSKFKPPKGEALKYVILDDDEDMLLSQQKHFIKCDSRYGFSATELRLASNSFLQQ